MSNSVLKDKSGNILDPKIPRYECHLELDGPPVKTGRKVDGKDEYVKRISLNQFPNATSKIFSTGITNATWVRHLVYMNSSNNWHLLPYHSLIDVSAGVSATVKNDASTVTINAGSDRSSLYGIAEIYFTYNS